MSFHGGDPTVVHPGTGPNGDLDVSTAESPRWATGADLPVSSYYCGISTSENSTRTPPVDSRTIPAKNAWASGVVTAALAAA